MIKQNTKNIYDVRSAFNHQHNPPPAKKNITTIFSPTMKGNLRALAENLNIMVFVLDGNT